MAHTSTTPDSPSTHPVTVAVADDDALARLAIESMIRRAAAVDLVGSATGVNGIVELTNLKHPQVVVLDWMMPGGGGPEAARRILGRCPETRVVALSAPDSPEALMEMMRAGATSFLVKGGSADELAQTIREAAGSR
jgi:DNA-binding NarL/FixJ family response regulator